MQKCKQVYNSKEFTDQPDPYPLYTKLNTLTKFNQIPRSMTNFTARVIFTVTSFLSQER